MMGNVYLQHIKRGVIVVKGLEIINGYIVKLEECLPYTNEEGVKKLKLALEEFYTIEKELQALYIIKKKCIYSRNLINVRIAEDYNDYLCLYKDKIEIQYLLTEKEFNLLKEVLFYE